MATHSSILAWRIPGMGEPGGLPSMALHRVGHDGLTFAFTLRTTHHNQVGVCLDAIMAQLHFRGSQITADGACSHEIKRCFLLGRKAMTNLDSVLKSRDITFQTKVHIVKAMVFPIMYECESWTIKKAEHCRIDAFELCWRRFLRVPWTARRSNQSIL